MTEHKRGFGSSNKTHLFFLYREMTVYLLTVSHSGFTFFPHLFASPLLLPFPVPAVVRGGKVIYWRSLASCYNFSFQISNFGLTKMLSFFLQKKKKKKKSKAIQRELTKISFFFFCTTFFISNQRAVVNRLRSLSVRNTHVSTLCMSLTEMRFSTFSTAHSSPFCFGWISCLYT